MAETTMTKVPTEHHRKIKSLKKNFKPYQNITIFGIYELVLSAGMKALGHTKSK